MILNFPGGVRPLEWTYFSERKIRNIDTCSSACIKAGAVCEVIADISSDVKRGTLLGVSDGTPVYASIAGRFAGLLEIEGDKYFVVMNGGESGEEVVSEPETRALTDLTREDIIESAKKLAIIDSRSGIPLWKLLESREKFRRVVIDCTEPDALSAITYRLCIDKARSIVGGAKVLLRATDALKCVFAAEYSHEKAFEALGEFAHDKKIFAMAPLEEKYPYSDRALVYALYVRTLAHKETAHERGILIIGAETAAALYDAMISGMPHIDRYLTVCGDGIIAGANFRVPRGMTKHDIIEHCGKAEGDWHLIENSLLSGKPLGGVINDNTRAIIAARKQNKIRRSCISCGKCVDACPVRLIPSEALAKRHKSLSRYCIACGACEFICPSGIPLLSLISPECMEKEAAE